MTRPWKDSYKVSFRVLPWSGPCCILVPAPVRQLRNWYSLSKDASTIPRTAAQAQKRIAIYRVSNPSTFHPRLWSKGSNGLLLDWWKVACLLVMIIRNTIGGKIAYHLKWEDGEVRLRWYASPPRRSTIQVAIGDAASNPCHAQARKNV